MNWLRGGVNRKTGLWLLYYLAMTGGAAILFLLIRQAGNRLTPGSIPSAAAVEIPGVQHNALLHVLLALIVIIVTARLVGLVFRYLRQPQVMGEVLGGIILGPSVLGHFFPDIANYILPQSAAPLLGIIAQLGVILFMFLVGVEVDLKIVRRSGRSTAAISHASILVPFLMGAVLALVLYQRYPSGQVSFTSFALFLGVSMSVTAFPVLARILTDLQMHRTSKGSMVLMCAAINDVLAWCLLAVVVSIVQADAGGAIITPILTVLFMGGIVLVVRPLATKIVPRLKTGRSFGEGPLALVIVAILASALATEYIGIHAIFGAFMLGAILPRTSLIAQTMTMRLEDVVKILLLPIFFAFTGMRTELGLLSTPQDWMMCGLVIVVATLGKFGGSFVAAKLLGHRTRDSAALGVLMNTRGLVELIVLNIGLDLGVISPTLFTMLVIMAVVTTFATTPLFHLITRKKPWTVENEEVLAPAVAHGS
ncbi:MAG: cation:proton antiporter [SAR202 cluster bacterium]|nr:cation:proton antiporter [SAR202 cluster bacterium]